MPKFVRNSHAVIPDTQCRKGVPMDHLTAFGNYIADHKPEVIIHLGDHYDMPSLSEYDKGKKSFEGRRYQDDIEAGNTGLEMLLAPINKLNTIRRKNKLALYKPRMIATLGNHENRITRLLQIEPRLEGAVSLEHLQFKKYGFDTHEFLQPVEADGVFYCLEENHRALTADLRHVPLKDLRVGDKLLAFDETGAPRKYREAVVLEHGFDERELYEVSLANGKTFLTTPDHQWLARTYRTSSHKWVRTDHLKIGSSQVVKFCDVWDTDTSYEAGYLAGMLDGEGCLCKPNCKQGGIQLSLSQKDNHAYRKVLRYLDALDIPHSEHVGLGLNEDVNNIRILGPSGDKLKLIGSVRADRLISRFKSEMLGRVQSADGAGDLVVVGIRKHGIGRIVKLKTSSGTLIADGYAHHNCHYFYNPNTGKPYGGRVHTRLATIGFSFTMGHQQGLEVAIKPLGNGNTVRGIVAGSFYQTDEEYKGPQANGHWRGALMKHEVKDGNYCLLELSMSYLLSNWL